MKKLTKSIAIVSLFFLGIVINISNPKEYQACDLTLKNIKALTEAYGETQQDWCRDNCDTCYGEVCAVFSNYVVCLGCRI
jgi:hypothetical protein